MQPQAAIAHHTFSSCFEETRQRFNRFAEERGLSDQINAFLVAEMEANQFDPSAYYAHMALNGLDLGKGVVAKRYPALDMLSLDIAHTYVDYDHAKQEHKNKAELERKRNSVSANFMETIKLLGPPQNYNEALAQLKTVLSIKYTHFLDPAHYEEYKNHCELLKSTINRFAQHQVTTKLGDIELELQNIMQQQHKSMNSMLELNQLQKNTINSINRVEQNMPHKKEIDHLIALLKQQGIEVNDQLYTLLVQSEATRNDIGKVLQFLEDEHQEKLLRAQHELKAANYQGLSDACQFVSELGRLTGSRELSTVAGIAHAGVQIHRAVDQIMTAGLSGMAVMGPYAAIGMAVLSIFSMFRRSSDPNRVIMKQLMRISKQITALHKDMSQHFQHLDERLSFIFQKMMENFESLQRSNTISVSNKLAEIQSQLETLSRITKIGFEDILLKDLKKQTSYNAEVRQGIIKNSITETEYQDRLRDIKEFIEAKSCSPLLNGSIYCHLLNANPANTSQLIELLKQANFRQLESLMGLLVNHAKNELNIPEFQQVNEKIIFHPRLWQIALETYLEFKKFNSEKYEYDPKNVNLNNFHAQLQNFLDFIYLLQNNKSLYQRLFSEIITHQLQLLTNYHKVIQESSAATPYQKQIKYNIPSNLMKHDESKKITNKFFSEKELLNFLPQVGITIPKKFLKAEKLGLGYFEFNMHIPEELYKKHHKHNGKYRFKKADIAGLEINFYLGGQKIVLYSKKEIKPCKFTQLEDMYAHIIKTCKNESPHTAESHKLIAQAIKQHKLTQKTQSAQRLASRLMDDPSYHQLLKLNHLLLAYLTCAGLPTQYIQRLSDKLFLSDLINPLEKYSRNPVGEPPHLQCCATETLLQEFDAILNKLIELRPTLLLSPEVLNLQEMLQRLPVNTTMAGNSLPANISTPISSSFFQSAPIVNGAPKDVKSPQNGQQRRVPKH